MHTPRSHMHTQSYTHSTYIRSHTLSLFLSHTHSHIQKFGQALHKGKQIPTGGCNMSHTIRSKCVKSTQMCQHTAGRDTMDETDNANVIRDVEQTEQGI